MHLIDSIIIILIAGAIGVSLAPKPKVPLEIFLLLGSLAVSIIPGHTQIAAEPTFIFSVILPPVLFSAAYFTSIHDFKRNARPITLLAVGLVIFTTTLIAVTTKFFIPGIPWACAFVLGAVLSPPDASAATALVKNFRLPRRVLTILEGESLINDATALVIFKVTLTAAVSGIFSLTESIIQFFTVATGGCLLGLVTGYLALNILFRLKENRAATLLSMVTAFITYSIAEHLHVSGVLATVTAGLMFGQCVPEYSTSLLRIEAKASWDLLLLIINSLAFTLLGLQLPGIVSVVWGDGFFSLFAIAATVFTLMVIGRFVWILIAAFIPRILIKRIREQDPMPPMSILIILSWVGMRGIVSLATLFAIPMTIMGDIPFPYRTEILFIAYTVIILSLVLPTISLPYIIQWLRLNSYPDDHRDEGIARKSIAQAAFQKLNASSNHPYATHLSNLYQTYLKRIENNLSEIPLSELNSEEQSFRSLNLATLEEERLELIRLRRQGTIHDEIFHTIMTELDFEYLRLTSSNKPLLVPE